MRFCIVESLPKALARLSLQEQNAVKITAFDLRMDPAHPELQFGRTDNGSRNGTASILRGVHTGTRPASSRRRCTGLRILRGSARHVPQGR